MRPEHTCGNSELGKEQYRRIGEDIETEAELDAIPKKIKEGCRLKATEEFDKQICC